MKESSNKGPETSLENKMARLKVLFDITIWQNSSLDMSRIARAIINDQKIRINRGGGFWNDHLRHSLQLWEAIGPWIEFSPTVLKSVQAHFEELSKKGRIR